MAVAIAGTLASCHMAEVAAVVAAVVVAAVAVVAAAAVVAALPVVRSRPSSTRPPALLRRPEKLDLKGYLGVFRYSRRAIRLVWSTNRALTLGLAIGSLIAGLLPTGIA